MNIVTIRDSYRTLDLHLSHKRVKEALDILHSLSKETQDSHLIDEVYSIEQSYKNMVQFLVDGFSDPQKESTYNQLIYNILNLGDEIVSTLLSLNITEFIDVKENDVPSALANIQLQLAGNEPDIEDLAVTIIREDLLDTLFTTITFSPILSQEEIGKIEKSLLYSDLTTDEKLTLLSALLLSLANFFDERKVHLLLKLAESHNAKLSARAVVAVTLILIKYNNRLRYYPTIINHIHTFSKDKDRTLEFKNILFQLLNTKETEKVSSKFTNEILPEIARLNPSVMKKLDLDNLLNEASRDDKTPDWDELINENPELIDKMDQIYEMQKEGLDLLSSTFKHLKNFSYFSTLHSWFQPFSTKNSFITHTLDLPGNEYLGIFPHFLEIIPSMCDSDKYSLFFSVIEMPIVQRDMIASLSKSELMDSARAVNENFSTNSTKASKNFSNLYIQDLYRFYTAYPKRAKFPDLLNPNIAIHDTLLYKLLYPGRVLLNEIGLYHFKKENWEKALEAFIVYNNNNEPQTGILQKIGYCYQKLNDYNNALDYFLKADIFESDKHWTLKKIGLCYGILNKPQEALNYYLMAEKIEPNNLHTQASIGQCYLQLERYDEALKYYFKVEYIDPKNQKVWKPIAWCSFQLNKFETSEKYYRKLLAIDNNFHDLISFGTLLWAMGRKSEAIDQYVKSIKTDGGSYALFAETFEQESVYLRDNKIDEIEIAAFLDQLKYKLE